MLTHPAPELAPADCRDDLRLEDYRSIVGVMDTVAGTAGHADLCDRLLRSLAREFGWTGAFLIEGETASHAPPVRCGSTSRYAPASLS